MIFIKYYIWVCDFEKKMYDIIYILAIKVTSGMISFLSDCHCYHGYVIKFQAHRDYAAGFKGCII